MSYTGLGATEAATPSVSEQTADAVALRLDPTKGKKYRAAKGAVLHVNQALTRAAETFAKTQAGQLVHAGGGAAQVAQQIYQNAKAGQYSPDANGVINVARDMNTFISTTTNFLVKAGVSEAAVREIRDWTAVATTCAVGGAGVATGVGAWGLVACGLTALAKLLSYFGSSEEYKEAWTTPRAVFNPAGESAPVIAADALRLAQVLRRVFQVSSFASLVQPLDGPDRFQWINSNRYPTRPGKTGPATDVLQPLNNPLPAHNLRTLLHVGAAYYNVAHPSVYTGDASGVWKRALYNVHDGLAFVAGYLHGFTPGGRGLMYRYTQDQDINQRAIGVGAWVARSAIAQTGSPVVTVTIKNVGDLASWRSGMIRPLGNEETVQVNFAPFLFVDALINYFGAITAFEMRGGAARKQLLYDYRLGAQNPVQHLFVRDDNRSGEPGAGGSGYSRRCWTNLERCTGNTCVLQQALVEKPTDYNVLRDVAVIRLTAAMSFLHQQLLWSGDAPFSRTDPVQRLDGIGQSDSIGPIDPVQWTRLPVDPRQAERTSTGWVLASEEQPRIRLTYPIIGPAARTSAVMPAPHTVTMNQGRYAPAVLGPMALLAKIDEQASLMQEAIRQAIVAGKTVIVSPTLMRLDPGVVSLLVPGKTGVLQVAQKMDVGGNLTGPLLLGAAAILAFKFLK